MLRAKNSGQNYKKAFRTLYKIKLQLFQAAR